MKLYVQVIAVAFVFLVTLVFFRSVAPRTRSLLFSRKEGAGWQDILSQSLGTYLTVTSIFGTLTSLATVYVFFIGSAKIFGWIAFVCCISLIIGARISNYFSQKIATIPRIERIFQADLPTGSLVTALFWSDDQKSKQTALISRWISMASISGILWLEFSVFGDISGVVLGIDLYQKAMFVFGMTGLVSWFTFRYGLRGFILADVLHASLIALACIALLIGVSTILELSATNISLFNVLAPLADVSTLIIFSLHVLVLNSFLVLTSESHWLRMWLFAGKMENKEVTKQVTAQGLTAVVWGALICVGLLASTITGKVELAALSPLLTKLSDISPIFLAFFWLGATAALFSTADMQFYCLTLLKRYDWQIGQIPETAEHIRQPTMSAIAIAAVFAGAFVVVRLWHIPIEKLVFTIVPLALNLAPTLVQVAFGKPATPAPMLISLLGYASCSLFGFIQPEESLTATLAAALIPAALSAWMFFKVKREREDANGRRYGF